MYKFRRINSNNTKLLFQNNLGKCYSMMEDKYLANEWYSMVDIYEKNLIPKMGCRYC